MTACEAVNTIDYSSGRLTENATEIMLKRYSRLIKTEDGSNRRETWQEICTRVCRTIAMGDAVLERKFFDHLFNLKFIPNSPSFTGAGTDLGQLSACFVLQIKDDLGRGENSIMKTLTSAVNIQQTGGGVGFNFSQIRPAGDLVGSSQGKASGVISFLRVYDGTFKVIQQGGIRRGANMAVLNVDHPEIFEFVHCKEVEGALTEFNISVGISDAFMHAVVHNEDWNLVNPRTKKVTRTVKAGDLFSEICECAWKNGEPGVVFLDRINQENPNKNLYTIESTNPCVTGDTLVYTKDGIFPIMDLANDFQKKHSIDSNDTDPSSSSSSSPCQQ